MKIPRIAVAATAGACLLGFAAGANGAGAKPLTAKAELRSCADGSRVGFGWLRERRSEEGVKQVDVLLLVHGLEDGDARAQGKRAVHIHETATCEPCGAAGGHFDPGPFGFSNPDGNHPYHSGDLINIKLRNGTGILRTRTTRVTLSPGPLSLFDDNGSAFIVHTGADTYCPQGAVAGCAGGARAACGIIEPGH